MTPALDYWNETSELEITSREAEHPPSGLGGIDTSIITDMVPLIMTLGVISMTLGMLQQMDFGRARPARRRKR